MFEMLSEPQLKFIDSGGSVFYALNTSDTSM